MKNIVIWIAVIYLMFIYAQIAVIRVSFVILISKTAHGEPETGK